ncbi:MAG: hypothetical protein ACYCS1_04355 [Gammaproteobacteria bacterium]
MDSKQKATLTFMVLAIGILILFFGPTILIPNLNNLFQYEYALLTHQTLNLDQMTFFSNAFLPINNQVSLVAYNSMLNGTFTPQLTNLQRYVAATGLNALPITSPVASGGSIGSPFTYVSNLNALTYANNPLNLPYFNNVTNYYYIYPEYVVQYTANCSALSSSQINLIQSTVTQWLSVTADCNATNNNLTFQGIVGISNSTATVVDQMFFLLNTNYSQSNNNYLDPLDSYYTNGTLAVNNTAINGTLLGYYANLSEPLIITNNSGVNTPINPIRNVFSGDVVNGTVLFDSLYCWNSTDTGLTNLLQTAGYSQYPYLYQYQLNGSTYLCLTVNSTDALLNGTSNLDGSNLTFSPVNITSNSSSALFSNYLFASAVAVNDTYQYLANGYSRTTVETVNSPYWFIPNSTEVFALQNSTQGVFSIIYASQYLTSSILPIKGQEPIYSLIPINTSGSGQSFTQTSIIDNITSYLFGEVLQNQTYQYQFYQPNQTSDPNATMVYCYSICSYGNNIVYQDYGYKYQFVDNNFGIFELPQLNQTIWYTPQFTIVDNTPFINDTNQFNSTYGQECLYLGNPYTCQYGLTPSQVFTQDTNYSTFVIYQQVDPNATYIVNGQKLIGWTNFEGYLQTQTAINPLITIAQLNEQTGNVEWSVTGVVEQTYTPFILIAPDNWQVNAGAYPSATPLTFSLWETVAIMIIFLAMIGVAYYISSIKFK